MSEEATTTAVTPDAPATASAEEIEAQSQAEIFSKLSSQKYRLSNLYWIEDINGKKIKFRPNWEQCEMQDKWHSLNVVLKCRQPGISTFTALRMLDYSLFCPHKTCGVIDKTDDDAKKKLAKIQFAYDHLDDPDDPETARIGSVIKRAIPLVIANTKELEWSNGSKIWAGTNMRGGTLQFLWCLHPGTEVMTPDGYFLKIENLKSGDKIINGKGRTSIVKMIVEKRSNESSVAIKMWGHPDPLKATISHKVLARTFRSGVPIWKPAGDIKPGDYLAFPITETSGHKKEYGFELGRIAGLYLAEGSLRKKELTFSIDRDEVREVLSWLEPFQSEFNSNRIYYSKSSRTAMVVINSWSRVEWLRERFGSGQEKFVSNKVFSYTSKFLMGLVWGYFYGDGCFTNFKYIQACGTRRQIIDQFKRILISLRFGCPCIYRNSENYRYGIKGKTRWDLNLGGAGNWKFRKVFGLPLPDIKTKSGKWRIAHGRAPEGKKMWRRGRDHYWMRVRSVEEIETPAKVYDLVMDDEPHSFLTPQGVVHNCTELGYTSFYNPEAALEIRKGALNTIHKGNTVVIESTHEGGKFGVFYGLVKLAMESRPPLSEMDWKFHFFPWWRSTQYVLPVDQWFKLEREDADYFDRLALRGIALTDDQKYWYVKKKAAIGSSIMKEFPSVEEECFEAVISGSIYGHLITQLRAKKRIVDMEHDRVAQFYTFWDIGYSDFTAIWLLQMVGTEIWALAYRCNCRENPPYYVAIIREWERFYDKPIAVNYLPHDADSKEKSGKSYRDYLRDAGLPNTQVVLRTPDEWLGINHLRSLLPRFYFHKTNCDKEWQHEGRTMPSGIGCLEGYHTKEDASTGVIKETPVHDDSSHGCSALRTFSESHLRGLLEGTSQVAADGRGGERKVILAGWNRSREDYMAVRRVIKN